MTLGVSTLLELLSIQNAPDQETEEPLNNNSKCQSKNPSYPASRRVHAHSAEQPPCIAHTQDSFSGAFHRTPYKHHQAQKQSKKHSKQASRQAAEFTVGLGDLQRLPGLFQGASGDLPPHQNQESKKLITRKPRRVRRRREGMLTMMRSTPAAHARASTAGMSAAWHCLPW
jgi:hypothetical protein